ncbi:hypothetical protein T556_08830 [Neisseria gonorrhoeae NG-k51.05]|nr:hypothetical protein T556_06610 [Neisseria gonorrhoeae NG-k51.05]APW54548.1 hypothetical protein T556_08830 [Neisseria gonorrhoeae NG-k51.05]
MRGTALNPFSNGLVPPQALQVRISSAILIFPFVSVA